MEYLILNFLPFLKEFLPWLIIIGGSVKWWFQRKDTEQSTSLSRIETLSKVEERLRLSLEKQLQITEAKLDIATKEIERMKLLLVQLQIEREKLKAEIDDLLGKINNPE